MKHTYIIEGMTCNNCKASVEKHINALENVTHVSVHLENGETEVTMDKHISTELLKKALPEKFTLSEKHEKNVFSSNITILSNLKFLKISTFSDFDFFGNKSFSLST